MDTVPVYSHPVLDVCSVCVERNRTTNDRIKCASASACEERDGTEERERLGVEEKKGCC